MEQEGRRVILYVVSHVCCSFCGGISQVLGVFVECEVIVYSAVNDVPMDTT